MLKKIVKQTGETLIEALISLTVLMLSGAAAAALIISSLQTTALSEDYLIAQNLIVEASEIVKNVRDTNWLLFWDHKEDCWLATKDTPLVDNDCGGGLPVASNLSAGTYRTIRHSNNQWHLDPVSQALELSKGPTYADNAKYGLDDSTGEYLHNDTAVSDDIKFYRQLEIKAITPNELKYKIKVEWYTGAKLNTFETEELVLTNYLQ